jgi:hypothetical protein
MLYRNLFAIFFFVTTSGCLHAQVYLPGYVVNNAGDTISGFLEIKEKTNNPSTVTFKKFEQSNDLITYKVKDLRGFSYRDRSSYERSYVSMTMDEVDLRLADDRRVEIKFDSVFLKLIQRGNRVTMYSYEDDVKKRFYIRQPRHDKPLELGFRVVKDGPNYTYKRSYRETLVSIAESGGMVTKPFVAKINRTDYNESSLLAIISEINGIVVEKKKAGEIQGKGLRVGAGAYLPSIIFSNENQYAENATGSVVPGVWLMAAYDFPKNGGVGKLIFRGELVVSSAKFEIKSYDDRFISNDVRIEHTFTKTNIGLGGSVIYNIVNKEDLKVFASLGLRANYALYDYTFDVYRTGDSGTSVMSSDAGKPRTFWSSIPFKAGVLVKRRIEVGVVYIPKRAINGPDSYYKYSTAVIEAGVVYHLNIKKQ